MITGIDTKNLKSKHCNKTNNNFGGQFTTVYHMIANINTITDVSQKWKMWSSV